MVTTLQNYTKSIVPEIAFKTQSAAVAALGGGILTSLASISSNLYNPAAEYLYFISKSLSTYGIISSTFSTFSADMPVVYNTKVRSPIEEVCNSLYNLNLEASNNISIINSLSVIAATQIQTAFALYTPTLQAAAAYESYLGYVNAKIATTDRNDPILNTAIVPELCNRAKTARQAVVAASNAYKKVGITAGTIAAAATKIAQNAILMGTLLSDTAVLVKKPSAYIDWSSLKIRVAKIESTTRGFGTAYDSANDLAPYQKDYMTANMDRIDLEALQTHVWSDIYDAVYGDVQTVIRLQADINQRKTWWFNYGPVVQNLINLAIKASPDNPIAGLAAAGLLNPVQSSQGIRYIDFGVGLQSYPIQDPGNTFGVIGEQSQLTLYQNQNILSNVAAVNYNVVQQNMLSNYWKCLLADPLLSYLNQVKDPPRSVFSVSDNAYVRIGSLSLPTFTPNRYGNYPLMGGMIFTGFPNTITGPAGSIMPFSLAFDYGRSPYQMKDSNTLQGIVQELDFNKMSPPEYVTDSSQFRGGDYSAPTNKDVAVMGKVGLAMIGMFAASFQQTIDPLGLMSLIGPEAGMSWPSAQHPLNTATLSLCQLYANAAASNVAGLSPDPLAIQIRQAVYEGQLDMWVLYNSILEKLDSSTSQNNGLDFSDATAAPTVSNFQDPYTTLQFIPIAVRVEGKVFDTNQTDLKIPQQRPPVIRKRRIPRLPPLPAVPTSKIYPAPIIVPPRRPDAPVKQARNEPRLGTLDPIAEEAVFKFKSKKPKPPIDPAAPVIEPFNVKRTQALIVTEYTVSVKMWAESAGHAGPGSQQKFLIKSGSTTIKIRVDATGARSVVSNANTKIDYATLLLDTTAGNIPAIVDKLNEKPGRGQFASDAANAAASAGSEAAVAARKKGLARTTSTGAPPTITTYSTDYKVEDTTQVTIIEDNTAVFDDLKAAYDAAVAAKIDEFNKAKEEYRKKEQAYNDAVAAREIDRAAAKGEFEVAQEQAKQKLIAANKKKLEDYAQHVLEVKRENSLIMERNRKLQERHAAAVAEAAEANRAVTLSKIADAVAQDTYNKAKKIRADIIKARRAAEDKAWDNEEARNRVFNDLDKAAADAENREIQTKNAAGAARADYEAARTGWGQTGSALAGIAEQGFALAGITTPTLRQAANEFLLNDDDLQITDLENNIASFAISQGISTVAGNLADFIGQVAYDAWKGELLNSFTAAKKEFLVNIKSAVRGARKITSISALLSKIIKGFSTILFNSASSYVRSIAAANTLPGGLAILDDSVDAMGRPVKGAAAYAARTASSATSTAGRIASGLGIAGNVFGAILGAQQMGCIPPFPL